MKVWPLFLLPLLVSDRAAAAPPSEEVASVGVMLSGVSIAGQSVELVGAGVAALAPLRGSWNVAATAQVQYAVSEGEPFGLQGTLGLERGYKLVPSTGLEARLGLGLCQNWAWGTGLTATGTLVTPDFGAAARQNVELTLRVGATTPQMWGEVVPIVVLDLKLMTWL